MKIAISRGLAEKYRLLLEDRFGNSDLPEYTASLIEAELRRSVASGYERDSLTGALSRYKLQQDLWHALCGLAGERSGGYDATFVCVDIQGFKHYVDQHGMAEGDEVLKRVAAEMLSSFGSTHVYRFGGDEFVAEIQGAAASLPLTDARVVLKRAVVTSSICSDWRTRGVANDGLLYYLHRAMVEGTPEGIKLTYRYPEL